MSVIEHSQADIDALVDFWHARNDGKLLDDHAREVLDGLALTRQLQGAVAALKKIAALADEQPSVHPTAREASKIAADYLTVGGQ